MARPSTANLDGYVHARNPQEYQRLRDQAHMWEAATREALSRAGLTTGMNVLDVGAGPGSVMSLMGELVGSSGSVTGLEIDAELSAQALADLRKQGGARFDYVVGDLLTLAPVPDAPFDFTFCRFLLMHMREPVTALERMACWTRSGGTLVAQEFDFGSICVEPPCPAMGEFNRLFEGVFRAHGRNLRAGRQLPAQFEAAGIGVPDGTCAAVNFFPLAELAPMLIGVYDGLYATAVDLGLADPVKAAAFRTDMTEAGEDGRYFCMTPVLVSAWKRLD